MDQVDRQIIELLRENGRRANVDIAREIGISEGTVRKRVERLLSGGALRVVGLAEPRKVGLTVRALISLKVELAQLELASQMLTHMPEVMSVYVVTGEYDLVIEAVFASNEHLMAFLGERVSQIPGVVGSTTAHVLRVVKQAAEWALPGAPTPKILIVDDDPDFVEATRMVLESAGYEARAASNGRDALRTMITDPPDLVLLDIMMDGVLDGWDASGRIRANPSLRRTPILVVSSITDSDYLAMFPTDEDHLIDNFVSKPVAPDRLLAEVRRLLGRRRA
jgi:Lrp/AsnC family transcriptional regulator for asnA, asnC and gidA